MDIVSGPDKEAVDPLPLTHSSETPSLNKPQPAAPRGESMILHWGRRKGWV